MFSKETLDKVKLAKQYIESISIGYLRQVPEHDGPRTKKSIKLEQNIYDG